MLNDITEMLKKIHHGDALELMKEIPPASFRVIVTSPPYNLRNSAGHGSMTKYTPGGMWNPRLMHGYSEYDDNMPHNEYIAWQRECMKEMIRIIRPDGAIFYNHKWRVQNGQLQRLGDEITKGFPVRQIIIWHRGGGINHNVTYFVPTYEVIYFIPGSSQTQLLGKEGECDVWKIGPSRRNFHPAPFPVELPLRAIRAVGGGPVLDPFIGSGTTALAAEQLGMAWMGIEKSEEYNRMAMERIGKGHTKALL